MGHIVVLEGPDGGGKTTLANFLATVHGFKYVHVGAPKYHENLLHTYAKILYDAHVSEANFVIDRLHLGESIYGPILRNRDSLGTEGQHLLQRMLTGYGARVVLCIPPFEVTRTTWASRTEHVKDEARLKEIYDRYNQLSGIRYDYTKAPHVNLRLVLTPALQLPRGVIGALYPKFLFVGERANHTDLDAPFIALGGSSSYLYSSLKQAGFLEKEIALVNRFTIYREENPLVAYWHTLGKPVIVTLGNRAAEVFPKANKLVHPAYHKRFQHGKQDHYVDQLRKIRDAHTKP